MTGNLTPTLEAAAIFLRNAMALLPEDVSYSQGSSKSADEADNSQTTESNLLIAAAPGNPIKGTEIGSLRLLKIHSLLFSNCIYLLSFGIGAQYLLQVHMLPLISEIHSWPFTMLKVF